MRSIRTTRELFSDEALTLALLAEIKRVSDIPTDRHRLQKHLFFLTYNWFIQRRKGFNYSFFRYRDGPITLELYQTEVDLAAVGLIESGPGWRIIPTEEGIALASELIESLWNAGDNYAFWEDIQILAQRWSEVSTKDILAEVYEMEIYPLGWREAWAVSDLPGWIDITRILEEEEAEAAIGFPNDWLDTFGMTINGVPQELEALIG